MIVQVCLRTLFELLGKTLLYRTCIIQITAISIATLLTSMLVLPTVHANGNVTEFVTRNAGPYEVSLGTTPTTPGIGNIHLSVKLLELVSGNAVTDAEVSVIAISPESAISDIGAIFAVNDLKSPYFYDVDTSVDEEGEWVFTINVLAEPGEESVDFIVVVKNRSPIPGILTFVLLVGLLVVLGSSLRGYIRETRVNPNRESLAEQLKGVRLGNMFIKTRRIGTIMALLFAIVVLQLACSTASEPQVREFDITISNNKMVPRVQTNTGYVLTRIRDIISANQDDDIIFHIKSDLEGGFHLHGYDILVDIGPSINSNIEFTANATGKFDLMLHLHDSESTSDHSDEESVVRLGSLEILPR